MYPQTFIENVLCWIREGLRHPPHALVVAMEHV